MDRNEELVDVDIIREMADLNMFTPGQQDVLICLLSGMESVDDIMKEMNITRCAVWNHKRTAMKKYDTFLEQKKKVDKSDTL